MFRYTPARAAWLASACIHISILILVAQSGNVEPDDDRESVVAPVEKPVEFVVWENEISIPNSVVANAPSETVQPPKMSEVKPVVVPVEYRPPVKDVVDLQRNPTGEIPRVEQTRSTVQNAEPTGTPNLFARSLETTPAMHGAIPEGLSIVYLLDRSASMGLIRESFAAGRAAVFQSVSVLPASSRFEIFTYESSVNTLVSSKRENWLKPDLGSLRTVRFELEKLTTEGRSRHDTALRRAISIEPDYIVLVTDAEDSELESLKPILRSSRKAMILYVARVISGKVSPIKELK